jgi:hypothetical protein
MMHKPCGANAGLGSSIDGSCDVLWIQNTGVGLLLRVGCNTLVSGELVMVA